MLAAKDQALTLKVKQMIHPTIHLNGTSRETLISEYREAYDALQLAQQALCKVTVHARDYYPQGDEAFKQAKDEHIARVLKLAEVNGDLIDLILKLVEPT